MNGLVEEFPFVRVFHGLCFTPGVEGADVDHAVLIGDRLFLVDAKNWGFGSYSWGVTSDNAKVVLRDGEFWTPGVVRMDVAARKWSEFLNRNGVVVDVSALIVLTKNSGRGGYVVDDIGAPRNVSLSTLDDTVELLRGVAASSEPVVFRRVVQKVSSQLQ